MPELMGLMSKQTAQCLPDGETCGFEAQCTWVPAASRRSRQLAALYIVSVPSMCTPNYIIRQL